MAGDVYREGITGVTADDIHFAERLGYVVKLLAIAEDERRRGGGAGAPAMVPVTHPLASVRESFNAVFIEGEAVGELMFYGRGAGGDADGHRPCSATCIDAAHNLPPAGRARTGVPAPEAADPAHGRAGSQYYLTLDVADRPGVLAAVAGVFGEHGVSIRSMEQEGPGRRGPPDLRHPHRRGARHAGHAARPARARRRRPGRHRSSGSSGRSEHVTWPGAGWRGLIEEYRDFLPGHRRHAGRHPAEGGTPLLPAPRLSRAGRAPTCYLKFEGPTPPGRSRTGA